MSTAIERIEKLEERVALLDGGWRPDAETARAFDGASGEAKDEGPLDAPSWMEPCRYGQAGPFGSQSGAHDFRLTSGGIDILAVCARCGAVRAA